MLVWSFRLVTARLIPRPLRRKQTLLVVLVLATSILTGCGGQGAPKAQLVLGPDFRFDAPGGWKVERTRRQTSATHDSELVRVATFPLLKPYRSALFGRVATELTARMAEVAKHVNGTVSGSRTVTAAGIRSHSYDVQVGDHVDQYTFVLRDTREYQLLCRRGSGSSDAACKQLIASFAVHR
jgi:hypothetical protein